jgi:RNA polymerase sigma factor (sigma-70 family)
MSKISLDPEVEKKLVKKAKKDKKAFGVLYEHYNKHIKNFFDYRLSDNQFSEDLTSKVFEKALKGLDNFQWQGVSFSAWLYKIAKNTLIDHYRTAGLKKVQALPSEEQLVSPHPTPSIEAEIYFEEEILKKVLDELPKREREIIYMKFFDGYKNKTISNLTGLSETNVGTIVYRTTRKLKEKLSK